MAQSTGRVAGKKAFVTGAAQGLGAAAARRLAQEGARVCLADINLAGAQAVAAEINAAHGAGTAFAFHLDVTQEDQWVEVLQQAAAAMGGLSVLVNNAGIGGDGPLETLDFALWKKVMSVNVDSVFLGAKHALAHMRAHQPGSIINLSSIAGLIANGNSPAYNASKAAVWLLSKNIALYCAKQGLDIRSNSIHPTFIDTPILDPFSERFGKEAAHAKLGRQIPLGHIGEPNDIANAVLYLASDESKFMTGAELKLDGGISAM
jgi:NAD(P)-dependent dehydrogenase (short-subunit alcohol dehydrogenase family)